MNSIKNGLSWNQPGDGGWQKQRIASGDSLNAKGANPIYPNAVINS